ncbi:MAG TPA: chorismate synthase [Thermoanaerobaculaceae bacterium]|nr:chorismate synthase [Thermoanaerobaculaceae bacterium]HRS16389.1 chorismate synthase [Thermoanaerobaculaceae bacterium]
MAGSSFGTLLRVTTAGESHGPGNVVIIDGIPAGLTLDLELLRAELRRRRPGQSRLVTQRREDDEPEVLAGLLGSVTTGAPIAILVRNRDARSSDYDELAELWRPGHADATYDLKFGMRDHRGGGRASARETVARVAAGAVAKQLLATFGCRLVGWVRQVGEVVAEVPDPAAVTLEQVETLPDGSPNLVRCPDPAAAAAMAALIERVRREQDSIGGIAEIIATGVPPGLGEPVFDKLKADLGKALLSIPAVMGVETGVGFGCAVLRGSQCNDAWVSAGPPRTATNRHGGTLGGISSGMPLLLRVAVKPASSIAREQATVRRDGTRATVRVKGRHDPCLLPRFVPVGEAMVALVLADHWLRARAAAPLPPAAGHRAPGSRS